MSRPPWAQLHPGRAGSCGSDSSEREARPTRCLPAPATRSLGARLPHSVPAPPGVALGLHRPGSLPWRAGFGALPPGRAAPRLPRPAVRMFVRVVERLFVRSDERVRTAPHSPEAESESARHSRAGGANASVAPFAGLLRTRCPAVRRSAGRSAIPLRCAAPPPVHAVRSVRPYVRPFVRVADWQPRARWGKARIHDRWQGAAAVAPTRLPFLSALCSTPGRQALLASLWRDALRPDTLCPARCAAEGKGGATWRRDRTRAQPCAAPFWAREHGEHGEDPPLARSEHRGTQPNVSSTSYPQ